jgi:hypothetical protein
VCVESAGSDGGLQRSDVDVELVGQLIERQQLGLSRVMRGRHSGALQYWSGNPSSPTVPGAEGLESDEEQRGELSLSQTGRAPQIAKLVHAEHTMPCGACVVKRSPALMAGDHGRFETCRDLAGKSAQSKVLSKSVDREFADSWRNLARPVISFDEHSPGDSLGWRNRRIL